MVDVLKLKTENAKLRLLQIFLLAATGLIVNFFHLTLMFGVDVFFGNAAFIIGVTLFGPWVGAFIAAIVTIPTFFLWGHPFFIVTCVCEAIFLGYSMRHFWGRTLFAATSFWLVPGCILVFAMYHFGTQMPVQGTTLIWLKQSINGIFDVLVANAILIGFQLLVRSEKRRAVLSFDTALFNTLIAMVFIPALLVLVFTSRSRMREVEKEVVENATHLGESIGLLVETWTRGRMNLLTTIAEKATEPKQATPAALQNNIELISSSFQGFQSILVTNTEGTTIAYTPSVSITGGPTVGINYADRAPFPQVKATLQPVVSDVFMGRSTTDQPIVAFTLPIVRDKQFVGVVSGSTLSSALREALLRYTSGRDISVTIFDGKNQVVVSSIAGVSPMMNRADVFPGEIDQKNENVYVRRPAMKGMPPLMLWGQSSYGVDLKIDRSYWNVVVEVPLAPYVSSLEIFYIENFSLILGLCLSGLLFSYFVSKLVTAPIGKLAFATTNLPERVEHENAKVEWPSSRLTEIDSLIVNFKGMSAALRGRFKELRIEMLERTRTQESLEAATAAAELASKAKSAFLANMSHEIRTPLTAVLGFSELLAQPNLSTTERSDAFRAITRNGDQLQRLIDDVLDFSKVEAGELKIETRWTSLDEILSGGVEPLEGLAKEKKLILQIEANTALPSGVETDSTRLRQILLNLVGNAVKFTSEGHVKVLVSFEQGEQRDGVLRFLVDDTGVGISMEDSHKLFKPFAQADVSMTRRFGGTGLGLVLSRRLARALGGDVCLVQCAVGKGCSFEASIQVKLRSASQKLYGSLNAARKSGESDASLQTDALLSSKPFSGVKILLVEDSKDVRFLVGTVLRKLGGDVGEAESGLEGIRKALDGAFDVILMDVQMPEMDGLEAVRILREKNYTGPIIALTAHALNEHRDLCLAAGFDAYLTKPVNFPQLTELALQLISNAKARTL